MALALPVEESAADVAVEPAPSALEAALARPRPLVVAAAWAVPPAVAAASALAMPESALADAEDVLPVPEVADVALAIPRPEASAFAFDVPPSAPEAAVANPRLAVAFAFAVPLFIALAVASELPKVWVVAFAFANEFVPVPVADESAEPAPLLLDDAVA